MISDVLTFWFGTPDLRAIPTPETMQRWFAGGDPFDAEIVARFGALLDAPGEVRAWATDAPGTLAAVLVLDQFSRNAFRGAARAFATDPIALALSEAAVADGVDRELGVTQRCFLYLPYQHAEDPAHQERAVQLYEALLADAIGTPAEALARGYLPFAQKHRAIIQRFGRYPGRNLALGREDTPEEAAWLAEGGETFGQRK